MILAVRRDLAAAVERRVLEDSGCLVRVVSDADIALAVARAGDADVLVIAHDMAEGLIAEVRADDALRLMPVIVLTAGEEARRQGIAVLEAGADDYLTAPVEPTELRARVTAALRVVTLERERLEAVEELTRRETSYRELAMEQGALRRVAAAVASGQPPGEVFALVAREVAELLGSEGGGVARFQSGGAHLVGAYSGDESLRSEVGMRIHLDGEGVTGRVARTGLPARVDDYQRVPGGSTTWRGRRSSVAAPVTVAGRLWGTVGAVSTRPGGLPPGAERRLARFAELVALAIGNAQSQAHIEELAMRDHLTGVYNRRAFEERLAEEVGRASRHGQPLSFMVLDVDHFKRINDTLGHPAGDRVLMEIARRLVAATRTGETIARIGGEEFGVVLPETPAAGAARAAERMRALIGGEPFADVGRVTVSAGVAELDAFGDAEALYRQADAALYRAKSEGRDRVTVWSPAMGPAPSPV